MSRKKVISYAQDEDITSYTHNLINKFVQIYIASGTHSIEGFTPISSQMYETITIQGNLYDELMAPKGNKPKEVFRKDDLWEYIDTIRLKNENSI